MEVTSYQLLCEPKNENDKIIIVFNKIKYVKSVSILGQLSLTISRAKSSNPSLEEFHINENEFDPHDWSFISNFLQGEKVTINSHTVLILLKLSNILQSKTLLKVVDDFYNKYPLSNQNCIERFNEKERFGINTSDEQKHIVNNFENISEGNLMKISNGITTLTSIFKKFGITYDPKVIINKIRKMSNEYFSLVKYANFKDSSIDELKQLSKEMKNKSNFEDQALKNICRQWITQKEEYEIYQKDITPIKDIDSQNCQSSRKRTKNQNKSMKDERIMFSAAACVLYVLAFIILIRHSGIIQLLIGLFPKLKKVLLPMLKATKSDNSAIKELSKNVKDERSYLQTMSSEFTQAIKESQSSLQNFMIKAFQDNGGCYKSPDENDNDNSKLSCCEIIQKKLDNLKSSIDGTQVTYNDFDDDETNDVSNSETPNYYNYISTKDFDNRILHLPDFHSQFPKEPFIVFQGYIYKYSHGEYWKKIFYQHINQSESLFQNRTEFDETNTEYKYSILYQIKDEKYKFNGKYEFLLEYPEIKGYNRWKQTSNPYITKLSQDSTKIDGYEPIHIDWPDTTESTSNNVNFEENKDSLSIVGDSRYLDYPWNNGLPRPPRVGISTINIWIRAPREEIENILEPLQILA